MKIPEKLFKDNQITVDRRTFLKNIGKVAVAMTGALGLGLSVEALRRTGQPEQLTREEFEERLNYLGAVAQVALRDSADANILLARLFGLELKLEDYQSILEKAIKGVQNGINPFDKDFWKKISVPPNIEGKTALRLKTLIEKKENVIS